MATSKMTTLYIYIYIPYYIYIIYRGLYRGPFFLYYSTDVGGGATRPSSQSTGPSKDPVSIAQAVSGRCPSVCLRRRFVGFAFFPFVFFLLGGGSLAYGRGM